MTSIPKYATRHPVQLSEAQMQWLSDQADQADTQKTTILYNLIDQSLRRKDNFSTLPELPKQGGYPKHIMAYLTVGQKDKIFRRDSNLSHYIRQIIQREIDTSSKETS